MMSEANLVIFPVQDILGLDSRARMNVPGTIEGNWRWRMPLTSLDSVAREIRQIVESCGRAGRK
jgi:4-alpha-glucanotransferase